jgi:hypothetical protein
MERIAVDAPATTNKFAELTDEELAVLNYALEELRFNMRKNWNQLHELALGFDINYIWEERGRQARKINDLILVIQKEKYVRDTAKRV